MEWENDCKSQQISKKKNYMNSRKNALDTFLCNMMQPRMKSLRSTKSASPF